MNIFKSLAYGLLVSSLLVFSGCEGNNSDAPVNLPDTNTTLPPDGNTTLPPIDLNATTDAKYLVMIGGNTFTTTGNLQTKEINILVFNSNGSTSTEGEITFQWPQEFIDGTLNDIGMISPAKATIVDGKVSFKYTSPYDLNNTENNVSSINFLFHSTTIADVNTTFHVDYNSSGDYSATDPILQTLILSDSTLNISSSNETQNLLLYAFTDQSTAVESADLQVKYPQNILSNNIDIGLLNTPISIQNGVQNLTYMGPGDVAKTISDLNVAGIIQPISLEIYDPTTNTNVILSLTFSDSTSVKSYAGYSFTSNPDHILVTSSQQESGVILYLEDNSSRPAVGETILLDYFDGTKGEVSTFSAVTDANGRAIFGYIAPVIADDNVTANFQDMSFTVEGADLADISVQLVSISIDTRASMVDFGDYNLTVLPETITIKEAGESKTVDLYLEDNSKRPVSGETILLDYFNGSQGTMNSFSGQTDANGHVAFNYTAPVVLDGNESYTLTFHGQNTTLNDVNVTIDVNTSAPSDPKYENYILTVYPENNVTIVAGGQSDTIDIYVENNDIHAPVADELVLVKFFDGSKGSMNSFSAITDSNGHIEFIYTAPESITSLSDYQLEFSLNESSTVHDLTTVTFSPSTPVIRLENPSITLDTDGQTESIVVLVFNQETNQTFNSGSIIVQYPSEIVNGTFSGGLFSQSEAFIVNGRATFAFTGPNPLTVDANSSLHFTFSYKEDTSVPSVDLTVNYTQPAEPEKIDVVLVGSEYIATLNSEAISISMNVFKDRQPMNTGEVRVRFPEDVLSGRDVGYFDSTAVNVANGQATFSYFAPKSLDANTSDLLFTFYHEENYEDTTAVFTVKIEPEVGQTILTDYELKSNLKDENITMNLESSKMLSFYVQEKGGTPLGDSNVTSITVTLLNPALGDLSDTNASTGTLKTITTEFKNNLSLRLDTFTKSGILPIKVETEFKGVNNEDMNTTEVYNVVIFSGPPTAISISYASTEVDNEFAKFKENLVVTVTDKYFNYVNSTPGISVSMIAGYTLDGAGDRLYQEPNLDGVHTDKKGTMNTGSPTTFDANNSAEDTFGNVDIGNEFLATFGQGYSYAASGSWNIATAEATQLILDEQFDSNETLNNLGYAVGNNFRQDTCRAGEEWVGTVSLDSENGKLNANGLAQVAVNYDYYLAGKDVVVAVNIVGYTASTDTTSKIGEAKKITLRSTGFSSDLVTLSKGFSGVVRLPIYLSDAKSEWYRNANFAFDIFTDDAVTINSWTTSVLTDCVQTNGIAYVDVNVDVDATKAGTIQIENIVVVNEF